MALPPPSEPENIQLVNYRLAITARILLHDLFQPLPRVIAALWFWRVVVALGSANYSRQPLPEILPRPSRFAVFCSRRPERRQTG